MIAFFWMMCRSHFLEAVFCCLEGRAVAPCLDIVILIMATLISGGIKSPGRQALNHLGRAPLRRLIKNILSCRVHLPCMRCIHRAQLKQGCFPLPLFHGFTLEGCPHSRYFGAAH